MGTDTMAAFAFRPIAFVHHKEKTKEGEKYASDF